MIPFSPPRIDEKTIEEVSKTLKSGWITTGPKTKEFEKEIANYCDVSNVLCVYSATAGLELILRWFGVKEGDEVIVPAYTYCASANVIIHCGATPVLVDIEEDFTLSVKKIKEAITYKTKVIIPVDIGGLPCNYDEINKLVADSDIKKLFSPNTKNQKTLNRILVLSDAAHSFGAIYNNKPSGNLTDITVFSFHAVKNLTSAEGGAICLNMPNSFDNKALYNELCTLSLNGQSKDAFSKTFGNWRYDVENAGYKCNMTDVLATIGLVEIRRYKNDMLVRRKAIFDEYTKAFASDSRFITPIYETNKKISSYHVYLLRIKNISEDQRDKLINKIFRKEVFVNVHFIPLPMLSFYKNLGYNISDYPETYNHYSCEISLPVYYDLSSEDVKTVINTIINSLNELK